MNRLCVALPTVKVTLAFLFEMADRVREHVPADPVVHVALRKLISALGMALRGQSCRRIAPSNESWRDAIRFRRTAGSETEHRRDALVTIEDSWFVEKHFTPAGKDHFDRFVDSVI